MMREQLLLLNKSRSLIWAWAGRIIRGRYQQSALGWLWAVVQPIATAAIFTIVFTYFVPVDTGKIPYLVFSYTAMVPWTLLAMSLTDMTLSLVQNMNLVTKIYFPREILPVASMLARLMDFAIALSFLAAMLVYYRRPVSIEAILYLPLIILIEMALILGIGIGCAAINVFYRDMDPLLRLVIQIWFYASPIIYSITVVPAWLRDYYFLNPMAGLIESYRDVLLKGTPPGSYLWPAAAFSLVVLIAGYWLFKHLENQFADIV
jgi:lipopolysaccharide transport system permease protein